MMEQLGHAVKVGFKSTRVLHLAVIGTGTMFAIGSDPWTRLFSILAFTLVAPLTAGITAGRQADALLTAFGRGRIEWKPMPELQMLAQDMGVKLNDKKPFGVTDRNVYAYSNMLTSRVIFERAFIERLSPDMLKSTAAHEFTHIKEGHSNKVLVIAMPIVMALAILTFNAPPVVTLVVSISAIFLLVAIVSRRNEYKADLGAAKAAGIMPMIETLTLIGKEKGMDRDSDTHPSPRKRIQRLMKLP